ncbi:Protein of unknown function [Pyronema omphalodes CBS 100304]|uniref:Uncharacterized protein n=1 Tax=Pyronema omphalodes (strain CBS 100304) TaxID=1076935 RepID=U4L0L8_PYROM|nr:Protein of unknown function [Pyronema omphalodes CBS 100304]
MRCGTNVTLTGDLQPTPPFVLKPSHIRLFDFSETYVSVSTFLFLRCSPRSLARSRLHLRTRLRIIITPLLDTKIRYQRP